MFSVKRFHTEKLPVSYGYFRFDEGTSGFKISSLISIGVQKHILKLKIVNLKGPSDAHYYFKFVENGIKFLVSYAY